MSAWIAVLAAGAASYALRLGPIRWAGTRDLPAALTRAFAFVGPAAFAALAAPAVVLSSGDAAPAVARLTAIAVALPVARSTRSTGATLAAGMTVLWLATAAVNP